MDPKTIPVLVVGANRSGTTWLSNLLCNHSQISGVQSDEHFGIIETNLFGRMQRVFGSLNSRVNKIAFIESWSQTDFFLATGIDKSEIYSLKSRDYVDIFRFVMREFSSRLGNSYWLQKLPTTEFRYLGSLQDDAKIIVITRNMLGNLASKHGLLQKKGIKASLTPVSYTHLTLPTIYSV